jgi:hypothetical protein
MAGLSTMLLIGGIAGTGLKVGAGLLGSGQEAAAMKEQGEFQKRQFDRNARVNDIQAEDATRRGDLESTSVLGASRREAGSQRAATGAQGIDANSGSAALVRADIQRAGELDAQTVKNNAWREAWGYKTEAANNRLSGFMAKQAGDKGAASTLATGGIRAAGDALDGMYKFRGGRK